MELAKFDSGTGIPVVFLHGMGNSCSVVKPFYKILSSRGYRIIAFDLPGHGDSGVLHGVNHRNLISVIGDSVVHNLQKLGIEKFVLVGISFGGTIAMNLAGMHPDKVCALALQGAPVHGKDLGLMKRLVFKLVYRFKWHFKGTDILYFFANNTAPFIDWFKGVHNFSVAIDKVKKNNTRAFNRDFWALCVRSLMDIDARKALNGFRNPILLLDGSLSHFKFTDTTFKLAKLIFKNNMDGVLEINMFPGVGHDLPEAEPRKFAESILSFLNKIYGKL